MSTKVILIILFFISRALCDCEVYTFDADFEEKFTTEVGVCLGMDLWDQILYNTTEVTGQDERSVAFISPRESLSCVSSYIFLMEASGSIEVNVYIGSPTETDQLLVFAYQQNVNGNDHVVGSAIDSLMNFEVGWHVIAFNLTGTNQYDGYLSFIGMASPNSIVLVDSFRYIPPEVDESLCPFYEDVILTTEITTETPVTNITETDETDTLPESTITPSDISEADDTTDYPAIEALPCKETWTLLRIILLVVGILIIVIILCVSFYELGRRNPKIKDTDIIEIDELPKTIIVPRVKSVYPNPIFKRYSINESNSR